MPIGGELGRIGFDHELLFIAADAVDPGNAAHGLSVAADDPVLHGAQIGEPSPPRRSASRPRASDRSHRAAKPGWPATGRFFAGWRIFHDIHQHFAEPGRHRTHLRLDAFGQAFACLGQPLGDLLAREIEIDAFVERSTVTWLNPLREIERVFQPGMPAIAVSTGKVTSRSMSSGPRRRDGVDLHLLVGDVGTASIGSRVSCHKPKAGDDEEEQTTAQRKRTDSAMSLAIMAYSSSPAPLPSSALSRNAFLVATSSGITMALLGAPTLG
jgi:hypothetical protein